MPSRTHYSAKAKRQRESHNERTVKDPSELVRDIEAVLANRILICHVDGGRLGLERETRAESTNEIGLGLSAR